MEQTNRRIRIGITQGDTNGVGYEVILKSFEETTLFELCTPIIYGNPRILTYHRKGLGLSTNFTTIQHIEEVEDDRLNVLVVDDKEVKVELGKPSPEAGQQALVALQRALQDLRQDGIDAIVTAPINKQTIQGDDFHFPGHTEYIQNQAGDGQQALMMLMSERLRVALVTTHLPVSQVAQAITQESVAQKLRILHHSLRRDFGISGPRIAVLALNPHAGDNGLLGTEEKEAIIPAMEQLRQEGIDTFGPYAADGFFGMHAYEHFDAVLAMYHDQGLAPFKALAEGNGVNFTAGLPVIRTSPAHGTAYDIAGRGEASPDSFRHAIYTATDVWRNRRFYDEALQNPLPKLFHDRREDERRSSRRSERPLPGGNQGQSVPQPGSAALKPGMPVAESEEPAAVAE